MKDQVGPAAPRPMMFLCLLAGLALCNGCASQSGELKMVSMDGKHDFQQDFSQAFISKDPTGDTDVVLIGQDKVDHSASAATASCRQIVHIRIYWKPLIGTKFEHPASTNASIHWYMLSNMPHCPDMLEYSGSGLVETDESSDSVSLIVRTAWMKAVNQRGSMVDPLGPSKLDGSIDAKVDPEEVKAVLASLKIAPVTEAHASQAAAKEPPRMSVR